MTTRSRCFAVLVLVTLAFTLNACAQPMSEEERQALSSEIEKVDAEIEAATLEDEKYAGGLIKALINSRLAILRETKAMLEQRASAGMFAIALTYTVDGKTFKPPLDTGERVAGIDRELASLDQKIAAQEAEAARYSGGLVQAMKLSAIATMEQTRAMLDQRRSALKYGLPQFVGFAQESGSGTSGSGGTPETAEER